MEISNRLIRFLGFAVLLAGVVTIGTAKDWEGISPLKSTRRDVELLLGKNDASTVVTYNLKDKKVLIWYSSGTCNSSTEANWNVPQDTVTSIHIFSHNAVRPTELSLDLTKFEKVRGDADLRDHFYYINREDGFGIGVQNLQDGRGEVVTEYLYGPTSKDSALKCKKSGDK